MNNQVPVLDSGRILSLSDEQLVAWYAKHPNPTIRAIVERMSYMMEKHRGEVLNAYQEGFAACQDHFEKPELAGLTPSELRLATVLNYAGE